MTTGAVSGRLQQFTERCGRFLGAGEGGFQAAEVAGDQRVAGGNVARLDDGLDLLQGHVE